MSQDQKTEVVSCPACRHLVRVPSDWLGQPVQCPECKATFKAPVKVGDTLTAPELLSQPAPAAAPRRKRWDAMLLLPAFGLMICGVMGAVVNGAFTWKINRDVDGGRAWARQQLEAMERFGLGEPGPPETKEQRLEQGTTRLLSYFCWIFPLMLVVSLGEFAGGLAMLLGWNYRVAQIGCVLGIVNFAHGCCIPGAAAGLWGLLMLSSDEGRQHFSPAR